MDLRKITFKEGCGGEVHKSSNHGSTFQKTLIASDRVQLKLDIAARMVQVSQLGNTSEGLLDYLVPIEALTMLHPMPAPKLKAAK